MLAWLWLKTKSWPWVKKNWMWLLLFPVALLAYLSGKDRGTVVVAPDRKESDAAKAFREKVEAEKAKAVSAAEKERVEKSQAVIQEHQETIEKLSDVQRSQAEDLVEDPVALNAYLKAVGQRTRNDS